MNQDIRDYGRLLGFVKPHLWVLAIAAVCMLIYSVLNGVSPVALIPVIDNIVSGKDIQINPHKYVPIAVTDFLNVVTDKINSVPPMKLLTTLLIGALVYFFLRNLFDFMQQYLMNDVSQRVIRDVKDKIYAKLLSLPMSFYGKQPTARLMSRITYDAAVIRDSISTGLMDIMLRPLEVVCHLSVVIAVVMIYGIPMKFLLTSIVLFPCILLPAAIIAKRLRQITTRAQEKMGDINTILFEIITGIRIVKAFSMQEYERKKFLAQNEVFYKLEMKTAKRMNIISPINEFTSTIYLVIVLYLAGKQIIDGTIPFGAFAAFLASVFMMIKPLKRFSKVYAIIQRALSSALRIFDILDKENEIKEDPNAPVLSEIQNNIMLENIHFRYDDEAVLDGVGLDVKKGDIVAIVGPSGAGKTTLVNLIPRFYDPEQGAVKFDGVDIRNANLKGIRDQIGIVTQEMLLFNDTVRNNITYGSSGHTDEDMIRAAEIANAHEFIMRMPAGYDTAIGEKGYRLSGGERQRISIARAIFKNPPILIFDEATSQLDTESERLVQEAIDRLMKNRTVFTIAHRLSTITHANMIIVLERGKIVGKGTHLQLLETCGLYKKLYEMQFLAPPESSKAA